MEKEGKALAKRATAVLPSLTHLSIGPLPEGYSQFFSHGDGCYVYDVDGKKYIDYMASYGPILLGHLDKRVDNAVLEQIRKGNCLEGPSEHMVRLAELLTEVIPFADWAYFAKNGSDVTSIAVRVARAHTGKRIMLRAPNSYHGSAPLFKEGSDRRLLREGILGSERSYQLPFEFNNLASVIKSVKEAGDDFAGIICSTFKWDYAQEQQLPTQEFLQGLRRICDEKGAVLICDDVRSSGIANGYEISALVGSENMRKAIGKVNASGSFWCNAVPIVAAIKTIEILRDNPDIHQNMENLGKKLRTDLEVAAKAQGIDDFQQTGPVQMPYFSFTSERDTMFMERKKIRTFCSVCAKQGIWFHPDHTMFLTAAHTNEDIKKTVQVAEVAFKTIMQQENFDSKL